VTIWLAAAAAFISGVCIANAVSVRRYSPRHVVAQVAIGGRGLFFSRTPDGTWWKLRLRSRRCIATSPTDWGDPPSAGGVREPRRPRAPGPLAASVKL
jgi:hypothetical protein